MKRCWSLGAAVLMGLVVLGAGGAALAVRGPGEEAPLRDVAGLRWATELPAEARSAQAVDDELFVLTVTDELVALDLVSGALRWSAQAPAGAATLVVRGGEVLVAGRDALYCRERADGRLRWERSWPGGTEDALAIDELGDDWLVRSIGRHRFAERLAPDGARLWTLGPSAGAYHLAGGRIFLLDERGVLRGHSLHSGAETFLAGFDPAYRLGADGLVCREDAGRDCWRIVEGPKLVPVRRSLGGAVPGALRSGPVDCDARGCLVDLPGGRRWFEGFVQLLPDELRVIRSADGPRTCIGCVGIEQPKLLRIESWSPDGARRQKVAFVRSLRAAEDRMGFVELAGRWVVATAWIE